MFFWGNNASLTAAVVTSPSKSLDCFVVTFDLTTLWSQRLMVCIRVTNFTTQDALLQRKASIGSVV